ncbi:MAG: hypothetical protein H0U46_02895 [Actinobacteria bacterium]|nr:hypothetical protein [Actinomycetota bacterium]
MQEQVSLKRTVIVRFPDGQTQYWLTDKAFSEGDAITQNGGSWIVSEVLDSGRIDTHTTVTLRLADS